MTRYIFLWGWLVVAGTIGVAQPPTAHSHKLQVSEPKDREQITAAGGRLVADYGGYQIYELDKLPAALAASPSLQHRDEYNRIFLNAATIDTTAPETVAQRKAAGAFAGRRMHLVQFAGPMLPAWYDALLKTGVKVVNYVPHNAYLGYGDAGSIARLQAWATTASFVQWEGTYQAAHRIHPHARPVDVRGQPRDIGTDHFIIQLQEDADANPATLALIDRLKLEPASPPEHVLHFVNIVAKLRPTDLDAIAAQADVVSIQPSFPSRLWDERQDQIIAGNLSGNSPSGPGYLAWLAGKGFTQAQFTSSGFVVDVSDSGIDNGTTSPGHFGLYISGNTNSSSRVVYNRLVGTPNAGSTIQGCDGHGNINSHIIAGYNDLSGFPHADSAGYLYGLGVCPFVKVGSSVIFDFSFTSPTFSDLQSRAYQDGARVSNNSWGNTSGNTYNTFSQQYDALVRDAQPAGATFSAAGNQEMVIVFAAGNSGSAANTVHAPATGKNVFVVAAGENVRSMNIANGGNSSVGNDGCATGDTGADNANDIIGFSSRGPCSDGRIKPDISAPGTHITGGAPQSSPPPSNTGTGTGLACFNGTGVCKLPGGGTAGSPSNYFPVAQQFYTESSGTSHSTPCVVGGCALLRQYFINNSLTSPSPAMTKAYLMNSARYMNGSGANDTLPSNNQGMGEMNLGTALDGLARVLRDELAADKFTSSGQTRNFTGVVTDNSKPFRVTLAWTDAPGSTTGAAYNNNLDLTVTVGGNTYKGNVFSGANSATGGSADAQNNVESVFLPAGVAGPFTVTVTATSINSDGVPNDADPLDQDFALVIYNGSPVAFDLQVTPGAGLNSTGTVGGAFSPASQIYVVSNATGSALSWKATNSQAWVSLSATNSTLSAGATTNVTVSINAGANSLPVSNYTDTVVFTNLTTGSGSTTRPVTLGVQAPVSTVFLADFEDGSGGSSADGFTYVASGSLSNLWHITTRRAVSPTHAQWYGLESTTNYNTGAQNGGNLQSPSISLVGVTAPVTLSFKYFLATENVSPYDAATVQIIAAGVTNALATLANAATFTTSSFDISTYTGKTVQVRFNFDTVDSVANTFEGWYIDDVQVTGGVSPTSTDLSISSTDSPDPVNVASNLMYSLVVTNRGLSAAASVIVTDTLPASVNFVSATPGCVFSAGQVICNAGTLNAGSTSNLNILVTPTAIGTITNVSLVTASSDTNAANNVTTNLTTVVDSPPIITGPPSPQNVCFNGTATFTITATGSNLVHHWQKNAVDLSDAGHYSGTGTATLNINPATGADVAGYRCYVSNTGGSVTSIVASLTLIAPQLAVTPSSFNFGTLTVGGTGQTSFLLTNNTCSALTGIATAAPPFAVVSGSSFTIAGNSSTNVLVSFTPPAESNYIGQVIFTSNGGNSTNALSGSGAIVPVANFTGAPTNGAAPLSVNFTDTSAGTITNRSWDFGDGNTLDTTSTSVFHGYSVAGVRTVRLVVAGPLGVSTNTRVNYITITNIVPSADLLLTQQATPNPVALGSSLTFSILVSNQGFAAASSVTVTDALPASFTFVSATPSQGSCATNAGIVICDLASLASNVSATVSIAVTPTSTGTFSNTATVSAAQPDPNLADNSATVAVIVPVDFDGDGLPDAWELAHFGDLNQNGAGDFDGDGFTNLQEFQANTNPTDAASAFHILAVTPESNDVLITWLAGGGTTNSVDYGNVVGSYSNISPNIILPVGPDVITNYPHLGGATNPSPVFYRIRLVP